MFAVSLPAASMAAGPETGDGTDRQKERATETAMWNNLMTYQAALSESLYPSRLTVTDPWCDFRAKTAIRNLGHLSLVKAHANSSFVLERLAPRDKGDDCFVLHLQLSGQSAYTHRGGEVSCPSETLLLTDAQNVVLAEQHSPADAIVIKIPGSLIRDQIRRVEDFCWTATKANIGSADILKNFVLSVWNWSEELNAVDRRMLPLSLFNLIESVFHNDHAAQKSDILETERLYHRLRQEIAARLSQPTLTVGDLTGAMGMSRSKLYRLTNRVGTTVERLIIDIRLDHIAKELATPDRPHVTLTELAFEAGFRDLSHFSRRFKRKFGKPPSAFRPPADG